jgi:hypothetical protein
MHARRRAHGADADHNGGIGVGCWLHGKYMTRSSAVRIADATVR